MSRNAEALATIRARAGDAPVALGLILGSGLGHLAHAVDGVAIPYGDLVTLLLAFFVVMYAISSVNESKYRVVSDSISAAFPSSREPTCLRSASSTGTSRSATAARRTWGVTWSAPR